MSDILFEKPHGRVFSKQAVGTAVYIAVAALLYFLSPWLTVALLSLLIAWTILRRPDIGLVLVAAGLPFQSLSPQMNSASISTLQPVTLLLPVILLAVFFRTLLTKGFRLKWSKISLSVLLFTVGLLLLVGVRLVIQPSNELISANIKTIGRFVMGALLFILILQYIDSAKRLRSVVMAFGVGGVIATAVGLSQYAGLQILAERGRDLGVTELGGLRVYSTLGSPHSFSYLSMLVVLLSMAMMLTAKNLRSKLWHGGAMVFFMSGLVASQTRAGLLGIIVGAIVLLVRRRNYGTIMLMLTALVALQLYALAVPEAAGRFGETVTSTGGRTKVSDPRLIIYQEGLDYICSNPVLGTGMIYQKIRDEGTAWTAHNSYLDMWIAGGIGLLLLFVLMIWRGCREMWRWADPRLESELLPYASWLLAAISGVAAFMMVDVLEADFYRPLAFYCLLGMAAVVVRLSKLRESSVR